jgi:hypothetical protein
LYLLLLGESEKVQNVPGSQAQFNLLFPAMVEQYEAWECDPSTAWNRCIGADRAAKFTFICASLMYAFLPPKR